jgi:hypothetical protein
MPIFNLKVSKIFQVLSRIPAIGIKNVAVLSVCHLTVFSSNNSLMNPFPSLLVLPENELASPSGLLQGDYSPR